MMRKTPSQSKSRRPSAHIILLHIGECDIAVQSKIISFEIFQIATKLGPHKIISDIE